MTNKGFGAHLCASLDFATSVLLALQVKYEAYYAHKNRAQCYAFNLFLANIVEEYSLLCCKMNEKLMSALTDVN
eukprot:1157298-Pelagomonas_calceolata.AAC.1